MSGELPVEMTAFRRNRRAGQGLDPGFEEILPRVLKSDASRHQKIEAWYHLTANLSYPLMIVLSSC